MPVDIHGKQYITVAERVTALHEKKYESVSITTEFLPITEMVVCKATVVINGATFTGTSAANPTKAIEKMSPYEVAETSAVGRALGFAGFGIVDGIATADEVVKATKSDPVMDATTPHKATGLIQNNSGLMCPGCHAPTGKYHTRNCEYAN